jgi:hypothetical protein
MSNNYITPDILKDNLKNDNNLNNYYQNVSLMQDTNLLKNLIFQENKNIQDRIMQEKNMQDKQILDKISNNQEEKHTEDNTNTENKIKQDRIYINNNQEQIIENKNIQENKKIWLDCRGEKIWTFSKNIICFLAFRQVLQDNNNIEIVIDIDEEKSCIHNLINFVSNKKFEDTDKLGDLLSTYGHETSILEAKKTIENHIKLVPKSVNPDGSVVWYNDRTTYVLSGYSNYMTSLIIKQLKRKQHSKIEDKITGKDRFFTLFF